MNIRLKRIVAFWIDWMLVWLPLVLVMFGLLRLLDQPWWLAFLGAFFGVTLAFAAVMFRDWILCGRSLGKRILGLYVYDQETLQKASPKQLALRNVFLFSYFVDGILLLVTGRTLGDRVANTVVLTKAGIEDYKERQSCPAPVHKPKKNPKKWMLICAIVLVCYIAFVGMLQIGLAGKKDDPGYDTAYRYLVESNAFQSQNGKASRIRLTHYHSEGIRETEKGRWSESVSIGVKTKGFHFQRVDCTQKETTDQTVQYTFGIGLQTYEVVCHKEDGILQVCRKCTQFD